MDDTQLLDRLVWSDLAYLLPEIVLIAAAIILTLVDLALPRKASRIYAAWSAAAAMVLSGLLVAWRMLDMNAGLAGPIELLSQSYRIDDFASVLKLIMLGAALLIILLGISTVRDQEVPDRGEFYTLLLPAVAGAMVMASAGNFISLYVGLELLSITTYVLVAMRKRMPQASEAGFKYIVIGGISSAFILFGMSYLYGITGSTNLADIYSVMYAGNAMGYEPLLYVGFFTLVAGFAAKIGAAPFHAWAPDVYQGATGAVAAFLAVISKVAALAALFRILYNSALPLLASSHAEGVRAAQDVFLLLKVLAAAAMVIGTTAALRQHNMKRLLALSGVANAGYLLVPMATSIANVQSNQLSAFLYYAAAYAFMTIGTFAICAIVAAGNNGNEEMKGFAGLYYRAPWTAGAMVVLMLSLAGLPVTGGFMGKLFILLGTAGTGAYWLAAIMIASTVVSYYFYFGIARQMFMRTAGTSQPLHVPAAAGTAIWICVAGTILLGVLPAPIMTWLAEHVSIFDDLRVLLPGQ